MADDFDQDPQGPGPKAPDKAKIARNLDRMAKANATEDEMAQYLASEGISDTPAATAPSKRVITSTPGQQFGALIARGATMGFAPKILGGIDALGAMVPKVEIAGHNITGGEGLPASEFGARYEKTRDRIRSAADDGIDQHPVAGRAAEFLGGALTAIPAGAAGVTREVIAHEAKRRSLAAAAARTGAIAGAVSGAGESTGDVEDYAKNMVGGALVGGAVGGGFGTLLGAVGGRLARRKVVADAYKEVAPVTDENRSAQQLGDLRTYEAFNRDGVTPERLRTEGEIVARTGRPDQRLVVDMGGKNTTGMARASRAVGGQGKENIDRTLLRRQKQQLPEIMAAVKKGSGVSDRDLFDTVDDLVLQADREATPFYEKAYAHGVVDSPEVDKHADKLIRLVPGIEDAAMRLADANDVPKSDLMQEVGKGQFKRTVQYYDYLKRAVDEQMKGEVGRGIVGQTRAGIKKTQHAMLEALDTAVPDFGTARAKFAGPMGVKDAAEAGAKFLREDPRAVARALSEMNDAEQKGFRLGGTDALRQLMEKVADTGDLAKRVMGNPAIRAKIRNLFPDTKEGNAGYVSYLRAMANQARQAGTKTAVMDGSQTADKIAEIAEMTGVNLGDVAMQAGKAVATGGLSLKGHVLGGITDYLARKADGVKGNVADAISRNMLTRATDQPAFTDFVRRMEAQGAGHTAKRLVGQTVGRGAGAGMGAVVAPSDATGGAGGLVARNTDAEIDAALKAGLKDPQEIRQYILAHRTP